MEALRFKTDMEEPERLIDVASIPRKLSGFTVEEHDRIFQDQINALRRLRADFGLQDVQSGRSVEQQIMETEDDSPGNDLPHTRPAPKNLTVQESINGICVIRYKIPSQMKGPARKQYLDSISGYQILHDGVQSLPTQVLFLFWSNAPNLTSISSGTALKKRGSRFTEIHLFQKSYC